MNTESSDHQLLEEIKHIDQHGAEFWSARELQKALGYTRWEGFLVVIRKAQKSQENSPITSTTQSSDHFRQVVKMVEIGSNVKKKIEDFELSRYACYLIAQNGDSRKTPIAFAQSYFAIQTRRQEISDIEERRRARLEARAKYTESDKKLSTIVENRNVSRRELATIKSNGDRILFGGHSTRQMKAKPGIDSTRTRKNRGLA